MGYPISDHFNGEVFFNPEASSRSTSKRRFGLLRMLRMRRDPALWAKWPARVENRPYPAPDPAEPSVTWIGHSSFLLRLPGLNILTDPVFSKRCSPTQLLGPKRVRDPGLTIEALPEIGLILLSHNHYDHMDLLALRRLRQLHPGAELVTTLGNAAFLAKKGLPGATELDWWQTTTLRGATITATPARHFAARTLWDRNRTLWAGFMLTVQERRLYFAGDTGYTRAFTEIRRRLGAPDLALLPIGAYEPREMMGPVHMNPADAVQAFSDLHAARAIGMHFGTFQLTAEPIDAPELHLAEARALAGMAEDAFITLDVGESTTLWPAHAEANLSGV